ncbi:MAG: anti-sigma factor [Runella slithyformis]|nr:MAG: anti-sigma factor [Runella slithyformis]TAF30985.1 MAG: anti-sigma factor [Cytophagales bacterium]
MNTIEYINSGILEEYLLGTVSPQEKQEVECMSKIYPEIKAELTQLEIALEQYAQLQSKTPPVHLKDKIFAQMQFAEPAAPEQELPEEKEDQTEAKQIDFRPVVTKSTPLWSQISVAASVLLAVVAGWSVWQLSQYKSQTQQLTAEVATAKQNANYSEALTAMYQSPDNKVIRLKGVEKSPESAVVAFWNQKTREVTLNVQSLPTLAADKQYQLWAIVGGKPVDMGMLDKDFAKKIIKMKIADGGAAAFAITIEKDGGSPTPTLDDMMVMGAAI